MISTQTKEFGDHHDEDRDQDGDYYGYNYDDKDDLYLLAPDEEAIASKACANKFFCSEISLAAEQEEKTSLLYISITYCLFYDRAGKQRVLNDFMRHHQ